jgi:Family of unknown function (DUF6049)
MTEVPLRILSTLAMTLAFLGVALTSPETAARASGGVADVAIIVPITVPERSTGLISAASLANLTSPFGLLNRELDQVIGHQVVLAIDPAILASIRVLGKSAPESAIAWLERLDAATNESFALSYADADLTLQLQAGSSGVLTPESFDFAINPTQIDDETLAREGSTPAPDATATPDQPDFTPRMLAFDYTTDGLAWPSANSVTTSDLDSIASAGYTETLVSSDNVRLADRSHAVASANNHALIVSDEGLSELFNNAVSSRTNAEWTPSKNALLAGIESVLARSDGGTASIVLTLDRTLSASDGDVGATVDAIAAMPQVQMSGLRAIAALAPVSTDLVGKRYAERDIKLVAELLSTEKRDVSYATIAKDPSQISSERRLDLLALLSNSWHTNPEGWELACGSYRGASELLRSSVQIVKGGAITFLADRASLPVTVSNALDQSVTVYVDVRPMSPLLKVENNRVELTIEPHSQRKGLVPVQSLSNGSVRLEISLFSETGAEVGEATVFKSTVQAGWETPVTVSVGVLVVLVFVFGIFRNVRKRLRRRSAFSAEHATATATKNE